MNQMEVSKENVFQEIIEFAVTVIWLGIAFGIAIMGGWKAFSNLESLRTTIVESLVVVFFAFVFHELAHRIASRRYGFKAVYHVWIPGLVLAMAASLIGFLFAAPGGVVIQMGQDTVENRGKLGKVALAGPMANIVLAVLFAVLSFILMYFYEFYLLSAGKSTGQMEPLVDTALRIGVIGVQINTWLALFNLLPFGGFDGYKVFQWNKKAWIISFVIAFVLFALMYWAQTALLG